MLATPPIFAPVHPVVFPPPATSSSAAPAPILSTAEGGCAHGQKASRGSHRHAQAAKAALELVRRLSDQVDRPASGAEEDDVDEEQGIIANLESRGWVYQETVQGVRIFHSSSQDIDVAAAPPPGLDRSTGSTFFPARSTGSSTPRGQGGPASRGLRADEALPFFRGEGWIEGSWRREDVAATITSLGARAVWDPRMDAARSQVVQHLNETDSLAHLSIRGSLVAPRDACLLSTTAADDRHGKENVTYVVATSVEDSLVPLSGTRTKIHINGFALRSLQRPPDFEPPPPPTALCPETSPPVRPSHRRTRSTASVMQSNSALLGTVPLPPLPSTTPENDSPTQRPHLIGSATHIGSFTQSPPRPTPPALYHNTSFYTSASSSYGASMGAIDAAGPYPLFPFGPPASAPRPKRASLTSPYFQGPGLAVSMVVRASAGTNLPQTTVNQLSVLLPLNIAAIGRFLAAHGFAPYIDRTCDGVKVREEDFDAHAGRYRAIFTVESAARDGANARGEARIRFFGGAFGRGRFHVEVRHVEPDGWRLEFDVPPGSAQESRLDMQRETEEIGGEGSGQWCTRLSVMLRASSEENDARQERKVSTASLLSPVDGDVPSRDPALQSGPLGGCTLVISPSATEPGLPVVVTVARSTNDSATLPLAKMRGMSTALAQASLVALDDHHLLYDSVEDLLACMTEGEARADMLIKATQLVVRELDIAREREAANAAVAAAAAAFAKRGRKSSTNSASTSRRDGSHRRGSAEVITLNNPFLRSRKVAPPPSDAPAQ